MREIIEDVLKLARSLGVDFADLRVTEGTGTSISVQDGIADRVNTGHASGAGVRVLVDGAWGFAPTNNATAEEMKRCVRDAVSMAKASSADVSDPGMVCDIEPVEDNVESEFEVDPREVPLSERVQVIFELERAARETDRRIVNTVASYRDSAGTSIIANTAGTYITGSAVRCGLNIHVTASDGDVRQSASKHQSNSLGYEMIRAIDPQTFAVATAQKAVALLAAKRAPAGKFDVIIDPLICGLLVHEAFGHNCEADAVWSGNSILRGKEGQQVAARGVNIYDDPTLPKLNGSFPYDHEGTPAKRHVLVEDGILQGYMHSLETAARFGVRPEGSCRCQGHNYGPIVRMSNTLIAAGDCSFEDMLADTKSGLYLAGGHWGYVFTARGQFTCNVENAWAIENGKLGQHYRNVCISGLTLETLSNVTAVGDEVRFELGGTCGKNGQGVPVDSGGPHLRISDVVVGGQE
ncbi:MAG: TldD/PmbA family protein [Acidobacteriota bacterium]|nr:TldD/PmbA family protein [Acidobacteriota bacterium]